MVEFTKTNIEELAAEIASMRSQSLEYNNYFGLEGIVGYYKTDKSLIITKDFEVFERLYMLSTDKDDLKSVLSNLSKDVVYAINIPSKGDITPWRDLLLEIGWIELEIYSRFNNLALEKNDAFDGSLACEEDLDRLVELMNKYFSPITDRLPLRHELLKNIQNKWVVVAKDENGYITGFLGFELHGRRAYTAIWVDEAKNGMYLYLNTIDYIRELGYNIAYTWARDKNRISVKSLKLLGFKPDGLKDYTFVNKNPDFKIWKLEG